MCNIVTELEIPMKLPRLIKMCLNETYSKFRVDKRLSDMFPTGDGLKKGDSLSLLLCSCKTGWLEIKWYIPASSLC